MANMLLSPLERTLTPDEVELLDRRRRRGQLFLTICLQCTVVTCLLTLWSGQDATYSPGWAHPVLYWNIVTFVLALFFGIRGMQLRRGASTMEFFSY